jgi:hypothetical protein
VITDTVDLSGYAGDYLVNWCAGSGTSFPAATARYLATYNGDPFGAGVENTTAIRAAGRPAITTAMGTASGGAAANLASISLGLAAGAASVSNLAILDAPAAGNIIAGHALTGGTLAVSAGVPVSVDIGALVLAGS